MNFWNPKNPIIEDMATAEAIAREVARNETKARYIGGHPGVGKVYTARQAAKRERVRPVLIVPRTAESFATDLWQARFAEMIILRVKTTSDPGICMTYQSLIGCGRVNYRNPATVSNAERDVPDPAIPAPEFDIPGAIIWTGDANYSDPSKLTPALRAQFHALVSLKLNPHWIRADSPQDRYEYSLYVAIEKRMLHGMNLTLAESNEVLRWYWLHAHRLPDATPRRLAIIAGIRKQSPVDWEVRCQRMLRPNVVTELDLGPRPVIECDPRIDRGRRAGEKSASNSLVPFGLP